MPVNFQEKFHFNFPLGNFLFLRNPFFVVVASALAAGPLWLVSPHLSIFALTLAAVAVFYRSERPLAVKMLLPPFTILVGFQLMRLLIGAPLMIAGHEWEYISGVFWAQVGGLLFLVFAFLGYRLVVPARNDLHLPFDDPGFNDRVLTPLARIGAACLLYATLSTILLFALGVKDRGDAGQHIVAEGWGRASWFSLLQVFHRAKIIGYILAPLAFMRSPMILRVALGGSLFVALGLSVLNGDRGAVLWPVIAMIVGTYLFVDFRRLRIERVALIAFVPAVFFLWIIDVYRNLDAFHETEITDIAGRIEAFGAIDEGLAKEEATAQRFGRSSGVLLTVGSRLWSGFDHLVFEMTPSVYPHAGFESFQALPLVFVPFSIGGNVQQAAIFGDAFLIASAYRDIWHEDARYGISLVADLYRRWGWFGLPVASLVFGMLFGGLWRAFAWVYHKQNAVLGLLLICMLFSVFFGKTYTTVMGSWKVFAYDFPKHLIVLLPLLVFFGLRSRGALAYGAIPGSQPGPALPAPPYRGPPFRLQPAHR
ncbi:MAG: hypothetical protein ACFB21_04395 [Opitutales bacterium]